MPKLTMYDLRQARKNGRQLIAIRTSDVNEAVAFAEAGMEFIMCMKEEVESLHSPLGAIQF